MVSKISESPPSSSKIRAVLANSAETVVETMPTRDRILIAPARTVLLPRGYDRHKRAVDLILAVPLAIVLLPVILLTALAVKLTSRGPAFYTQSRVGRLGHCFRIYKIRTMQHNCEKMTGARWAVKNDSRTTWIGRMLRKTHLDELPQILNVLKGDMSLVGPRPERPEFTVILEAAVPRYRDRMLVRPGVTGLAQVYLPPDTDVDSVKRKLVYDIHYIQSMSLWLDLRLMVATFVQAGGVPCRLTRFLLGLPAMSTIESTIAPEPETPGDTVPALAGPS